MLAGHTCLHGATWLPEVLCHNSEQTNANPHSHIEDAVPHSTRKGRNDR